MNLKDLYSANMSCSHKRTHAKLSDPKTPLWKFLLKLAGYILVFQVIGYLFLSSLVNIFKS